MSLFRYIFIVVLLGTISCEDVIDVDIEEAAGDLVIDAWVDSRNQEQVIRLTIAQAYFDNITVPAVEAMVSIHNTNTNQTFDFDYTGFNGIYQWTPIGDQVLGTEGDLLTLSIDRRNQSYTATTSINRVPSLDSIGQEFRDNEVFFDDGIYTEFFARDFEGAGDAYWIKSFKNGVYLDDANELNIAYDAGFDAGSRIDGLIFIPPIRELINEINEDGLSMPWEPGQEIRVELHSISIPAFNFLEIARDQILNGSNGIFTLPLANARSNISKSDGSPALGFFNVASVSSRSQVIVDP